MARSTPRPRSEAAGEHEAPRDFVTFSVASQLFGIPVLRVQDILETDRIAAVPLAPPEVRGSINLRGRIVTVIDVRTRLGLRPGDGEASPRARGMGVTVENDHDLYTLLVDRVGDVVTLSADLHEDNPSTLDPEWREYARGVFHLDGRLMVELDVDRLLAIQTAA